MKTTTFVQYANPVEESDDRNILVSYSDGTSEILKISRINAMSGDEGQACIDLYVNQKNLFLSIKNQCDQL